MYASVSVSVDTDTSQAGVTVSPGAFDWLKDVYGPKAWRLREENEFVVGARQGAAYALRYANPPVDLSRTQVTVEVIEFTYVDSNLATVAYATCHAVWKALGAEGTLLPQVEGKHIIFPEHNPGDHDTNSPAA